MCVVRTTESVPTSVLRVASSSHLRQLSARPWNGRVDDSFFGDTVRVGCRKLKRYSTQLNTLRLASLSSWSTNLTGNYSSQVGVVTLDCFPVQTFAYQQVLACFGLLSYGPDLIHRCIFFFLVVYTWEVQCAYPGRHLIKKEKLRADI